LTRAPHALVISRHALLGVQGDLDAAKKEFSLAMARQNHKRRNVVPHLALAALHYQQGAFADALAL
jgi:hypothetical protein